MKTEVLEPCEGPHCREMVEQHFMRGRTALYCSNECRQRAYYYRNRQEELVKPEASTQCLGHGCTETISQKPGRGRTALYCSNACKQRAFYHRKVQPKKDAQFEAFMQEVTHEEQPAQTSNPV